jgi:hypothetical protein
VSLIPCPECGEQISTEAKTCPRCCGNPLRAKSGGGKVVGYGCLTIIGILVLLWIVGSLLPRSTSWEGISVQGAVDVCRKTAAMARRGGGSESRSYQDCMESYRQDLSRRSSKP